MTNSKFLRWNVGCDNKKTLSIKPIIVSLFLQKRWFDIKCKYLPKNVSLWYQLKIKWLAFKIIVISKKFSIFSSPISIVNCNRGWNVLKIFRVWLRREEEAANAMSFTYLKKKGGINIKDSRALVSNISLVKRCLR